MQTILFFFNYFLVRYFKYLNGKRHLKSYSKLALAPFNGYNSSTKTPSSSIHFDSLLKKRLKIVSTHDPIFHWVGAVKGKLQGLLLLFVFVCPPSSQAFPLGPRQQQRQKGRSELLLTSSLAGSTPARLPPSSLLLFVHTVGAACTTGFYTILGTPAIIGSCTSSSHSQGAKSTPLDLNHSLQIDRQVSQAELPGIEKGS